MSKILVVDDEIKACELLKRFLEAKGHEVIIATNGKDALTLAREKHPQLVILDIMMPNIDGYHFCRLLKFDAKFKHIPIIIVSARTMKADKELGLACGGDEYITKPYDMNKLIDTVERHLSSLK
ncbi:MAG: two-component response regulator [Candidatus Scalindua rubra]|uniref:Two-component response regulator n=1 Tax=Candidatus Scalindua rubra TaxID=1872076 RepID=A0A1E3X4Q0_9BACT|nr:MAG: two-component response regulator [Candidatus Scalindua rubra]